MAMRVINWEERLRVGKGGTPSMGHSGRHLGMPTRKRVRISIQGVAEETV